LAQNWTRPVTQPATRRLKWRRLRPPMPMPTWAELSPKWQQLFTSIGRLRTLVKWTKIEPVSCAPKTLSHSTLHWSRLTWDRERERWQIAPAILLSLRWRHMEWSCCAATHRFVRRGVRSPESEHAPVEPVHGGAPHWKSGWPNNRRAGTTLYCSTWSVPVAGTRQPGADEASTPLF
jgi:hypothetical protein